MNEWLAIAPQARPAQGQTGCMVSLNDFADRTPRVLTEGEVVDLGGGKRVRFIDTPHTPHGWDAGLLYEESTRTLLCGDLFTQLGNDGALTDGDGAAALRELADDYDRRISGKAFAASQSAVA